MPLDSAVESAIEEVVSECGQSNKVAKRLISWLQEMSERELSVEEDLEHLEALKQAVTLVGADEQ